jgi:hypothetical protein
MASETANPAAGGSGARDADLAETTIGIHLGPRPRIFQERIDFAAINRAAISALPAILARLLPGGTRAGSEWMARNLARADRRPGSFKINLRSGRWADFATGDKGGDPVSLVAYLEGCSQGEAARLLGRMLGIDTRDGGRHG